MTVISAMRFNENEGAIVADEQSSSASRKYDFATKLHTYELQKGIAVIGGSGATDMLHEIAWHANDIKSSDADHFVQQLNEVTIAVKNRIVEGYMQATFCLSVADIQTGMRQLPNGSSVPIANFITQEYLKTISGDNSNAQVSNSGFLALTKDAKGIQIFLVTSSNTVPIRIARPYGSIGSGSDMADDALSSFFDDKPREDRSNIDPIEGLAALLWATERAATRNQGVGGTPLISIIQNDKIYTPSEHNSRLATEIVKATRKGHLTNGFYRGALDALLYKNEDPILVEKEFLQRAENKDSLLRYLRGYKQPQEVHVNT